MGFQDVFCFRIMFLLYYLKLSSGSGLCPPTFMQFTACDQLVQLFHWPEIDPTGCDNANNMRNMYDMREHKTNQLTHFNALRTIAAQTIGFTVHTQRNFERNIAIFKVLISVN